MVAAATKPIEEVFEALAGALHELDQHGEAMAALHLAMAVDCLRASLDSETFRHRGQGHLKLVASS